MDEQAPTTPTPDPHRDEPLPPEQEGTRPGTDPAVRPEQDEPNGPLAGLVSAGAASVKEEAAEVAGDSDAEAEALLAQMGVEDEGIASGQLLGLVAAVLVGVAALALVLIFLFYIPYRTQVGDREAGEARATDQEILRTEATAKIGNYSRTDSTYGLPIARAMGLVAAQYGAADSVGRAESRAEWNERGVTRGMYTAVQDTPQQGEIPPRTLPPGDGDEQVGVDDDVDTIEAIAPDAASETIE